MFKLIIKYNLINKSLTLHYLIIINNLTYRIQILILYRHPYSFLFYLHYLVFIQL